MSTTNPPYPPLPPLRLATPTDIPRIATVAVSGFYNSNLGSWTRPLHHRFPSDTFASYASIFATAIYDQMQVCVVIEDRYDPGESEKTGADVVPDRLYKGLEGKSEGESVVVGVACWKFEDGSGRVGQFVPSPSENVALDYDGGPGRDLDPYRVEQLDPPAYAASDKHFKGMQTLERTVVHPAYSGRGYGRKLVEWGLALAKMDGVSQGVLASEAGARLYLRMGYEKVGTVVGRDERDGSETVCTLLVHRFEKDES